MTTNPHMQRINMHMQRLIANGRKSGNDWMPVPADYESVRRNPPIPCGAHGCDLEAHWNPAAGSYACESRHVKSRTGEWRQF